MILEEETFKEFGYYPSDLKPKSSKKILAACDGCGKIREICKYSCPDFCISCAQKGERNHAYGKHLSKETREKISKANKGRKHNELTKQKIGKAHKGKYVSEETKRKMSEATKGMHHSRETKKKISETQIGEKSHNFGKTFTKEHIQKLSEATKKYFKNNPLGLERLRKMRKHQKFPQHHTKPELIFENICKQNNLDFHYVGDGSLWIGKKGEKQLNPDFIEANGKKIIVEVFGDYWHSPLLNRNMKEYGTFEYRKEHYKQFGWKSIFLWESDLKRKDAGEFVLNLLKKGGVI